MNKTNRQFALVTGGTSGIGYELVKLLADDGYNIVLVARTESDLERVSKEISEKHDVEVRTIAKDLFDRENAFALYSEIVTANIQIDILVNDAGHGAYGEFVDTDIRKELSIIDLN